MKAVAWVISPTNALQCLIAHKKMEKHLNRTIDLEILHYYPATDVDMTRDIFQTVQKLARNVNPLIPCRGITYDEGLSAATLKNMRRHADFIFLAHDVVGTFFETLREIYPTAKSVCYGDALGQFFQREVHLGYLDKGNNLLDSLSMTIKKILKRNPPVARSLPKDYAVLTIPVSQAKFPMDTVLLIPEKSIALDIITSCAANDNALTQYCQTLMREMEEHNGQTCLFMTENMSEGNFISHEDEADMYAESIRQHCPKGTLIYIKQHPGEQHDRVSLLTERLSNHYTVRKFNTDFKRYPIELFQSILEKCTIIGMFYPAISLKYLYNTDVIQPMDSALIDHYFEKRFRKSYKNAISLIMIPLKRLKNWDGKGLLYNGR